MANEPCVFCGIAAGDVAAETLYAWNDAIAIEPLRPVVAGHVLVLPRQHVADAVENPEVTAVVMRRVAQYLARMELGAANVITSIGAAATQTVMHLHVHIVPRWAGDGLMLPWSTSGNPLA